MDNRTIEQVRENEDRLIKELQQKENKEKEIREYIEKASYLQGNKILEEKELLEILNKEVN